MESERELTRYAIDETGKLAYIGYNNRAYYIWGIGDYGLLHGVGSFLKRETLPFNPFIIYEPSFDEIENYYKNLDGLFGNL